MTTHTHHHEEMLASLLDGRMPRNLTWSEVVELIKQVGAVEANGNDEYTFEVRGNWAYFKRPSGHNLEVEEISRLRSFLKNAMADTAQPEQTAPGRVVVVIDHHAAHIYQDLGGSVLKDEVTVKPYDPFGFHLRLIHRKEAHYEGDRVPEEASFYEEIAKDLVTAREIILVGHGTGKSNAMDFLVAYLKSHHPETAAKVIATETADLSALTEPEIEEIAKKHIRGADAVSV